MGTISLICKIRMMGDFIPFYDSYDFCFLKMGLIRQVWILDGH